MRTVSFIDASGPITVQMLCDIVSLVDEVPPPPFEVEEWTRNERLLVYDWAARELQKANDHPYVRRRDKPWLLARLQERDTDVLSQELVDRQGWLDATKSALDAKTNECDELKTRIAALEEQLVVARAERPEDFNVH